MKAIFFGTPDYVLPILKTVAKSNEIVAVVTQPPRPVGREQFKEYSPVDDWAHKKGVPKFFDFNKPLPEADFGVCAAYGKIIPEGVIKAFPFGILNIHPSLLPLYRGASPIPAAIINNDKETGATVNKMDEKMDHGPIVSQFKEEIEENDTNTTLRERLFNRAAEVLVTLIPAYLSGKINLKAQDHKKATFTQILSRDDGHVDLKKDSPEEIERKLRAYSPWPGVWTTMENGKRLKIIKGHLEEKKLVLDEVQLEGKNPVSYQEFKAGYPQFAF